MNDVWHGGCGMSIANTGTLCGPALQIAGDAFVTCWNCRTPWTPCVFIDFAQSSAFGMSPPVSQNTSLTPARFACALMPLEITCTIGTDSRLVAYPITMPLPLPG